MIRLTVDDYRKRVFLSQREWVPTHYCLVVTLGRWILPIKLWKLRKEG